MQVLKFGGSSVANATRISAMMDIVHSALKKDKVLLVCSAISGCTDYLLNNEDFNPLWNRHSDIINRLFTGEECLETKALISDYFEELEDCPEDERVSYGEIFSTLIIASRFAAEDIDVEWLDSRELIKVSENGQLLEELSYSNICSAVESCPDCELFVAPGFIASYLDGKVTNLGRGGSDYSAAIFAAALKANSLQIWTDVPGIMSANPKEISSAHTIPYMSYNSAFTLADNGAKVLYAPAVKPAMQAGIDIRMLNTFDPSNCGTVISTERAVEQWCGVSALKFDDKARICLVGENISSREDTLYRIHNSLSKNGISPIAEIYGSDSIFYIDVSLLVVKEALAVIHKEFFEDSTPTTINVYIAGNGAVANALISLIDTASSTIKERTAKIIHIAGQSDSKSYVIGNCFSVIAKNDFSVIAKEQSDCGNHRPYEQNDTNQFQSNYNDEFINEICNTASPKSVFVDCTNDEHIYLAYEKLFSRGINIVSSNRRSLSIPYTKYAALKSAARQNACFFRYDTTVGTSLPILESIASSANCSDEIESIEAVVSCTLNNIFSSYDGSESMATLLRKAQESGLSEKDPRIDIAGKDVLRKLLIIAREAGVALEENDVKISPILGSEFFNCSLKEFYDKLEDYESHFVANALKLAQNGLRQRFVAILKKNNLRPYEQNATGLPHLSARNDDSLSLQRSDSFVIANNSSLGWNNPFVIAKDSLLRGDNPFVIAKEQSDCGNLRSKYNDDSISAEIKMINVGPESPFYWINGTENVIIIKSKHSSPLVIKGAGEGAKQAAIGIIKDILL